MLIEMEKKLRKALSLGKESAKLKRVNKDKDKETKFLKGENGILKVQNEELKSKIEELMKKNNQGRPLYTNQISSTANYGSSSEEANRLKKELHDKDSKL
mmetsp:Transcript_47311/g.34601  ORF Transcript_47311/g.34601 Transcript_47311/m.34601 type:complete len:100 (+) Transcript_47311:1283-1582(+)